VAEFISASPGRGRAPPLQLKRIQVRVNFPLTLTLSRQGREDYVDFAVKGKHLVLGIRDFLNTVGAGLVPAREL